MRERCANTTIQHKERENTETDRERGRERRTVPERMRNLIDCRNIMPFFNGTIMQQ